MDTNVRGGSMVMDAVKDRRLPNIIDRVQMLHDLAANIDATTRDVGDRLLGSEPAADEGGKEGVPQVDGDLSQLDICLDLLERNLRRAQESAARLTLI